MAGGPIPAIDYPTPARRPAYSVLDKTGTWAALGKTSPHWRHSLAQMLDETASLAGSTAGYRNEPGRAIGGAFAP
ncbi:MAG: sugar nucleotide-binding protein [Pseudomonadota bacterium]|nr:sugar nucleotide-binding protein [Pseudomonadota bacterium]